MAICEVCLASTCCHCECSIIGHGVEVNGNIFCCAHCAKQEGRHGVQDRVEEDARKSA